MKRNYRQNLHYRKLIQKSMQAWRNDMEKPSKSQRYMSNDEELVLPDILCKKSNQTNESKNVDKSKTVEEKPKGNEAIENKKKSSQIKKNNAEKNKTNNGKSTKKNDDDKFGFHGALCDDFIEDDS